MEDTSLSVIVDNKLPVSEAAPEEETVLNSKQEQCTLGWSSDSQILVSDCGLIFYTVIKEFCGKCGADSEKENIIC